MKVDLDLLEALANAASAYVPGEWEDRGYGRVRCPGSHEPGYSQVVADVEGREIQSTCDDISAYIVAAQPANILPLLREVRELRAANEWISVEEKLPDLSAAINGGDWPEYLIMARYGMQVATFKGDWQDGDSMAFDGVTHWRELPKGPTE